MLVFLPIHAAGIYNNGRGVSGKCLSDYAVSSYIPNLSVLANKLSSTKEGSMLMISQPDASGLSFIPSTKLEIQRVQKQLLANKIQTLVLDSQNDVINQVLNLLDSFTCVHLACHASQNLKAPLKSAFHLSGGPMELSSIVQKNLPHADFAFLSACQTSTGDQDLSEEAVHLAAGMLAAGYKSVVATMWSIYDDFGPIIADSFYKSLLENGHGKLHGAGAAQALHCAIESLKENSGIYKLPDPLLVWVPYIHVGI